MAGEREERMKSVIGLKNVVIAQLLTDTDEETTYDTPEAVEGAIDMSITPNNADPDVQYADDIEFDVIQPDPEVTVALEMTQLPLDIRAGIEGAKLDNKGVMVQSANDTPPYPRHADDGAVPYQGGRHHHPPDGTGGIYRHQAHQRRSLEVHCR